MAWICWAGISCGAPTQGGRSDTLVRTAAMHCCSGMLPAECAALNDCCTLLGKSYRA